MCGLYTEIHISDTNTRPTVRETHVGTWVHTYIHIQKSMGLPPHSCDVVYAQGQAFPGQKCKRDGKKERK